MFRGVYFLRSGELSEKLSRGEVTDDLAFIHLLVYSILFTSYISIPVVVTCSADSELGFRYQALSFIAFAGVQYWGMKWLYRTNSQGDGKDFFLRWAALSLPVGVQVLIISVVLGAVYGAVVGASAVGWANGFPAYVWEVTGILYGALIQVIYYRLMQADLTICSSGPQQAASD